MRKLIIAFAAVLSLAFSAPALGAVGTPTLSGTATVISGGVQLTSNFADATAGNDAGAVTFPVTGTTLSQLTTLSAVYTITHGDCGGGSPRFQVTIGGKNLFVYLGPSPSFTGCTANVSTNSGNLVGTTDQCRVDLSQFVAGKQCSTWAEALATLGSQPIQSISFVTDGGWKMADKLQTVLLQSVTINTQTFTFGTQAGGGGNVSPGQFCKALRDRMGRAAFNELWSTSGTQNGMGKCVSTIAHARNAGKTEQQLLAAVDACTAKGLKGAALGACVAAQDGVAATLTEQQEAKAQRGKGKAKGKKR